MHSNIELEVHGEIIFLMRGSLHGRSRDKFVLFDLSLGERRMLMEQEQEAYRSINEENNADAVSKAIPCVALGCMF